MDPTLSDRLQAVAEALRLAGLPAVFCGPDEDRTAPVVRAILDGTRPDPELVLELTPVPGLDDLSILQLLVGLPVALAPAHLGTLGRSLLELNSECLLPRFGMRADARLLYYRAMVPGRPDDLDVEMLVEVVWTVAYLLDRYLPLIRPVASGEQDLATAVQALGACLRSSDTPPVD